MSGHQQQKRTSRETRGQVLYHVNIPRINRGGLLATQLSEKGRQSECHLLGCEFNPACNTLGVFYLKLMRPAVEALKDHPVEQLQNADAREILHRRRLLHSARVGGRTPGPCADGSSRGDRAPLQQAHSSHDG